MSVERAIPRTTNEVFTRDYAFQTYEMYSMRIPRAYETGARNLAALGGGVHAGDSILEIGAGTGNSTIVLAESNPKFKEIVAFEPSSGFLSATAYKFKGLTIGFNLKELPEDLQSFFEELRSRATAYQDRVVIVNGRAESLPFKDSTFDKVYGFQVIHWLAFSDDDLQGEHPEYLSVSLKEAHRVLKQNGLFIFNTSAHQIDVGELAIGRNYYHLLKHPFYLAYNAELQRLIQNERQEKEFTFEKDKYQNIFTLDSLLDLVIQAGFEPEIINGKKFDLNCMLMSERKFIAAIKAGAQMRTFTNPQLTKLDDETKKTLVERALDESVSRHSELLTIPCAEIVISFVLKKRQILTKIVECL